MGMGLYDATFATLGCAFGAASRSAITSVTLVAGLSSTVTWPLSSYLVTAAGWRTAFLVQAGLQVLVSAALYLIVAPRGTPSGAQQAPCIPRSPSTRPERAVVASLAAVIAVASAVGAAMTVFLPLTLRDQGHGPEAAVLIAALLGPAQLSSRLAEFSLGRFYKPVVTLVASFVLTAGGLALLLVSSAIPGVLAYGAGMGLAWIARGTVPLAMVPLSAYPIVAGWLGLVGMLSLAIAPIAASILIEAYAPKTLVAALLILTAIGLVPALGLWRRTRRTSAP
jgi:predicted MFS family arabinose efflux permease